MRVVDLLPFDEYVQSLNRKRMSAGALFYDTAGRILLLEPSYKPHWDIPGGAVEADEAPWTTVAREVREEIGIVRPFTRPLVIDYVRSDGRLPEGVAFVFDGGSVTDEQVASLSLDDPEIVSARLCALTEAESKIKPTLLRRLTVALNAAATGSLMLCEEGIPAE